VSSRVKYRLWELDPGDEFECAGYHGNRRGVLIQSAENGSSATIELPAVMKQGNKPAKPALREEWSVGSMVYRVHSKYSLKGGKNGG
jgi:hypothetical protein